MLKSIEDKKKQISKLMAQIDKARSKCKHPTEFLEKKYGANTGGYDGPNFDLYWATFYCTKCGDIWTCDSKEDSEGYHRDAKKVKEFSN